MFISVQSSSILCVYTVFCVMNNCTTYYINLKLHKTLSVFAYCMFVGMFIPVFCFLYTIRRPVFVSLLLIHYEYSCLQFMLIYYDTVRIS